MTTRSRILDAAREVTADEGWSHVTMARVGRMAGVSRQSVYNEMGTRSGLAQALVDREVGEFLRVVGDDLDGSGPLLEGVERATRSVLLMARDSPLLHAVLSSAQGADQDLLPLLTVQSQPILAAATRLVSDRLRDSYGLQAAQRAVETVVRLVLSHALQPGTDPDRAAADIAWAAGRLLE